MSYLGNAPARSFISFERQVFSIVNSQTAYALSHSVTNENDIRLVVNNVVQEPGSGKAYTATGTALTLSAALTNGTDEMYCVFLGRATATNAPGAGSVGTVQLADNATTLAKMASGTDGNIISYDASGNPVAVATGNDGQVLTSTGAGSPPAFETPASADNTPAFAAYQSSGQNIDSGTTTIVNLQTEIFDTDSAFASNAFTVPSGEGGKYYISAAIRADASWAATGQFNVMVFIGNSGDNGLFASYNIAASNGNGGAVSGILALSAGDSITMRIFHNEGGTEGLQSGRYCTVFSGYKLIGI